MATLDEWMAAAWEKGYSAGNLDGYFGTHDKATNPYTGVNQYDDEEEEQNVEKINNRAQMASLAEGLGVRVDWHEPDEQGVSARVVGNHLDNAMGSEAGHLNCGEYNVVISKDGQEVAVVNLATLLALASSDNYYGTSA